MSVKILIDDIIGFYFWQGKDWLLFTYLVTIAASVFITLFGIKKGLKKSQIFYFCLLVFWIVTVITLTVLCRGTRTRLKYDLTPFWSWRSAFSGNRRGFLMVAENILLLMPIGFLLPLTDRDRWKMGRTVLTGFLFSLGVELCQFLLKRGQFEVDDLINNTLGVLIGCVTVRSALLLWDRLFLKRSAENESE
jgi:glycopeptide antibiotics resistance protein